MAAAAFGIGTPSEEFANDPNIVDVKPMEFLAWSPMLFLILLFGLVPGLIFNVTDPAVDANLSECFQADLGDGNEDSFDIGTCEREGLEVALANLGVVSTAEGE